MKDGFESEDGTRGKYTIQITFNISEWADVHLSL